MRHLPVLEPVPLNQTNPSSCSLFICASCSCAIIPPLAPSTCKGVANVPQTLPAPSYFFLSAFLTWPAWSPEGALGMTPACPSSRATVSEGWAPTDNQYLHTNALPAQSCTCCIGMRTPA